VIMGGGHPLYTDDNQLDDTPDYSWIAEDTFSSLTAGESDFTYFDDDSAFESLANGDVTPDQQYFGLAQVRETLQHNRSGESTSPYDTPLNDVVDLSTMSKGALNVLNQDADGFQVMIEGGAIDWAGHANDIARDIEEVQAFNDAVETVVAWVEENSNWDETLVIVTADHETGYLTGDNDDPNWSAMTGAAGIVPTHGWHSGNHTNQLVPIFFRGAGSQDIIDAAGGTDPIRGRYIDNVDIADLTINRWW
jgi:Alkaline phosphatase